MASAHGFDLDTFERLRRARRLAVVFVIGYLPLGLSLFFLNAPQFTGTVALALWLAVTLASLWYLRTHECPRCGQLFYADSKWGQTNLRIPFSGQCMHCGFTLAHAAEDRL